MSCMPLRAAQDLREVLCQAVRTKEACYGKDHVEVAITLMNLADVYAVLGELDLQREILERALAIECSYYGEDHFKVARVRFNLARCLERLGAHESAVAEMRIAHMLFEKGLGVDHMRTRAALQWLCKDGRETKASTAAEASGGTLDSNTATANFVTRWVQWQQTLCTQRI